MKIEDADDDKKSYFERDFNMLLYGIRSQDFVRKLGSRKDRMPGLGAASLAPSDLGKGSLVV